MASLWARILKAGRVYGFEPFDWEQCNAFMERAKNVRPVLVNVQSIAERLTGTTIYLGDVAQDIVPCHPEMWLEFIDGRGIRHGSWVSRIDCAALTAAIREAFPAPENARFLIQQADLIEYQESASLLSITSVYVDAMGLCVSRTFETHHPRFEQQAVSAFAFACEALTIMNTRGTRIDPPLNHCEVVRPNRAPSSVWHTIHLPRFQAPPLENAEIAPYVLEKREHWVRAHRRDYRHGAGMFGRVKALVWVPEFQRGNPELGTVHQSFKVHRNESPA